MDATPATMTNNQPRVTYWHKNQVVITFLANRPISTDPISIIQTLHLTNVNDFLVANGYSLRSFTTQDVPHPHVFDEDDGDDGDDEANGSKEGLLSEGLEVLGEGIRTVGEGLEALGERLEGLGENLIQRAEGGGGSSGGSGLNSTIGKYLFPASAVSTLVMSFFHVQPTNGDQAMDSTVAVVNLLNGASNRSPINLKGVPFFTAMPHWLNGGCYDPNGQVTHGCPVTPPYPVPAADVCSSSPGRWPITLPVLPADLQTATRKGVRVFVLDTLPTPGQLNNAASSAHNAGDHNLLLDTMVAGMVSASPFNAPAPAINLNYQDLPDSLDVASPDQPATGKDVYGNLVGYPVVDHGVFVAGIIRDIAPDATIECVRVLNDFGVGDTDTLAATLHGIADRIGVGDLQGQKVVINLSLVATPSDEEIVQYGIPEDQIDAIRAGLAVPFNALANLGVIFVASSGNDSTKDSMNMSRCRFRPRYPAAFAYYPPQPIASMIPVGAVDKNGNAAPYSNYPGDSGIATYGGSLMTPIPAIAPPPPAAGTNPSGATAVELPPDALIGVYSSPVYPALWEYDSAPLQSPPPPDYPEYPAPNANAWAYWSGTSFATPIISALAARALEAQPSVNVPQTVISAAGNSTTQWTRLKAGSDGMCSEDCSGDSCKAGPLIVARQDCQAMQ